MPIIDNQPCWTSALAQRVRHHFWLKAAGVTVVTLLFLAGYFFLLRHPFGNPTVMPLTKLDAAIPLYPPMMIAYLSLWLYVGVGPGLEARLVDLWNYAAWMGAMCACGLAIFLLWPSQTPLVALADVDGFGFELLKGLDAPGNACPSMHVAAAVFTALRVHGTLRRLSAPSWPKAINALWCTAILYSTLAVKQHVIVDVAGGAVLAVVFVYLSQANKPRPT